jgi:DNA (cytosine-5)-methyltransferase 1
VLNYPLNGFDEGKKMMGFPPDFEFPVAKIQAMKQLGNSVAVTAIEAVAMEMLQLLNALFKSCHFGFSLM